MAKAIAVMIGLYLAFHGLIGLMIEGTHFLIFNVDITLDVVYLLSAGILLYVGVLRVSTFAVRAGTALVAALLTLIGGLGLLDDRLGGAAPEGLTMMDFFVFFGLAAALLVAAVQRRAGEPLYGETESESWEG